MVVEKTYWVLGAVVFAVLLLSATPIILGHATLSEDSNFDWIISTADSSIRMDAVRSARELTAPENFRSRRRQLGVNYGRLNRRNWVGDLSLRYHATDGSNLLTATKLKAICDIENLLMTHAGGKNERMRTSDIPDVPSPAYSSVCRLARPECAEKDRDGNAILDDVTGAPPACAAGESTQCKMQDGSVLSFFFPAKNDGSWDCANPFAIETSAAALTAPQTMASFGWFLGRDVSVSGSTSRLRSTLRMAGMPFAGEGGDKDRKENEPRKRALGPLGAELQKEFFDYFGMDAWTDDSVKDGVDVIFWSNELAGHNFFEDMISADLSYALGSIVFVLCIMCVHSKSFFLGGLGMIQVLCSLPMALFLYRTVAGITFITQMHILSIYLVLGIGADDLFVFYDAWIQSEFEPGHNKDLVARMDYTYKRAAGAMLTTSFTTCVAFIATAISPLMPLSAFGIFAACAVFLNYVLVMTTFPVLVIIWETTGRKSCCCCNLPCCGGHPSHSNSATKVEIVTPAQPVSGDKQQADAAHPTVPEDLNPVDYGHLRKMEKCFVLCYTPCIQGPYRFVAVFLVGVSFIIMGFFAFQLSPPTKQEKWFPDTHMVQRLMSSNVNYYGGDVVEYTEVDITWGIAGIDRSIMGPKGETYSRWSPSYRGVAEFDGDFSALGTPAVHEFFWETGQLLEKKSCGVIGCMDGTNKLTRPLNDGMGSLGMDHRAVESFYVAWRRWYSNDQAQGCSYLETTRAPCASHSAGTCSGATKEQCQGDRSSDCFWAAPEGDQVPAGYNSGGDCFSMASFDELPVGADFVDSLRVFRQLDWSQSSKYKEKIGFIDNELKFLTISVLTTYATTHARAHTHAHARTLLTVCLCFFRLEQDQPQDRVVSIIEIFDDFVGERNAVAPAGLTNAIYSAPRGDFAWASTQQGLVDNVFNGFRIVFPAAFLTLMAATRNWIVSIYAIVTIAGIVAQVLGMCKAVFGWELGISESIAAVIVIGFAVDFTVHLAHMYVDSSAPTRSEKMAHSARTMGVTVVMGGITTMGAGALQTCSVRCTSSVCVGLNACWFWCVRFVHVVLRRDVLHEVLHSHCLDDRILSQRCTVLLHATHSDHRTCWRPGQLGWVLR